MKGERSAPRPCRAWSQAGTIVIRSAGSSSARARSTARRVTRAGPNAIITRWRGMGASDVGMAPPSAATAPSEVTFAMWSDRASSRARRTCTNGDRLSGGRRRRQAPCPAPAGPRSGRPSRSGTHDTEVQIPCASTRTSRRSTPTATSRPPTTASASRWRSCRRATASTVRPTTLPGLVKSEGLRAEIRGTNQAVRNAQDGVSLVQTAEGALNEVHSILQRMRELAVSAANTATSDGVAEQAEIDQLLAGARRRSARRTKFAGQHGLRRLRPRDLPRRRRLGRLAECHDQLALVGTHVGIGHRQR